MPRIREDKHQATCARPGCGKPFFQRRADQEYCSQDCSNKAFPGTGGRKPQAGLQPRNCVTCGREFQPYRANSITCSRDCYRKTDTYQAAQAAQNERRKDPQIAAERVAQRKARPNYREQQRGYVKRQFLKRYGLTLEEYELKLAAQGGRCMICGAEPGPDGKRSASRLHQDHDHETGKNRDLLCGRCNVMLGMAGDDPTLLRAAAAYIERHRAAP